MYKVCCVVCIYIYIYIYIYIFVSFFICLLYTNRYSILYVIVSFLQCQMVGSICLWSNHDHHYASVQTSRHPRRSKPQYVYTHGHATQSRPSSARALRNALKPTYLHMKGDVHSVCCGSLHYMLLDPGACLNLQQQCRFLVYSV